MFKNKRCKLKFRKTYQYVDWGSWKEVKDAYLISVLLELQSKYGFEIISTKFQDCFNDSYIKIKCNKEDKNKIFGEYCLRLNGQIEDISF